VNEGSSETMRAEMYAPLLEYWADAPTRYKAAQKLGMEIPVSATVVAA